MQDYPIDEEYLSQCGASVFDLAQYAVNMAVTVIRFAQSRPEERQAAIEIVERYGDVRSIRDLPPDVKRALLVKNYEEEEVVAMEEEGILCIVCANDIPREDRRKYPHWKHTDRFACVECDSYRPPQDLQ